MFLFALSLVMALPCETSFSTFDDSSCIIPVATEMEPCIQLLKNKKYAYVFEGEPGSSFLTLPLKTESKASQRKRSTDPRELRWVFEHISKIAFRMCINCGAIETTQWRYRQNTNDLICNPCILYENRNKCARPISMKKDFIQTRKRKRKSLESPKAKKSVKKEIKEDDQHSYVPNYDFPNFENLKMRAPDSFLPSYVPEVGNQQLVSLNYNSEVNHIQDTVQVSSGDISSMCDLLFDNQHRQYYQSVQEPEFYFPPYAMEAMEKIFGNFLS